jgi:hypothetical protein
MTESSVTAIAWKPPTTDRDRERITDKDRER